jgi:hypothetical protein
MVPSDMLQISYAESPAPVCTSHRVHSSPRCPRSAPPTVAYPAIPWRTRNRRNLQTRRRCNPSRFPNTRQVKAQAVARYRSWRGCRASQRSRGEKHREQTNSEKTSSKHMADSVPHTRARPQARDRAEKRSHARPQLLLELDLFHRPLTRRLVESRRSLKGQLRRQGDPPPRLAWY